MYASSDEPGEDVIRAVKLVNDIARVISLYKALGSHPEKVFYVDDVEVLAFIYGTILKMKREHRSLGRGFWQELMKLIYSKTVIEEFNEIAETRIDEKTLEDMLKIVTPPASSLRKLIADFYFYLRAILTENIHDPVYRRIMEKLNRLLREWITRKIDIRVFLSQLKKLKDEVEEYERRVQGKLPSDRIVESINTYINNEILKAKYELKLSYTKNEIERILKRKPLSIKDSDKKRLAKALLNDLFTELKETLNQMRMEREIAKIADNLVEEFIVKELERVVRKDGKGGD